MHQLFIGNTSNGITAAQLSRIRFVNPIGKLRGSYSAAILATGEIVASPRNVVLVGGCTSNDATDPDSLAYWDQQTVYPEFSTNVLAISAGNPNLALRADGTALTWGPSGLPIPSALNTGLAAISAGQFHSLALRSNGTVVAWGYQYDGTRTNIPPGLSNVVAISAGEGDSLALRVDGTIVRWGSIGDTNVPSAAIPAIAVSAGAAHFLALKADGTVVGWGESSYGETDIPAGLSNVVAIEAGNSASLALKSDGMVTAWGGNWAGQTNVPPGLSNVVAISAGNSHMLALKNDGTVIAWGNTNLPGGEVVPPWLSNARAISAGGDYSLVLLQGGPFLRALATNPSRSNGVFSETLPTRSGHVYALEHSTDLTGGNWSIAWPLVAGRAGTATFFGTNAIASRKFYRVREW